MEFIPTEAEIAIIKDLRLISPSQKQAMARAIHAISLKPYTQPTKSLNVIPLRASR